MPKPKERIYVVTGIHENIWDLAKKLTRRFCRACDFFPLQRISVAINGCFEEFKSCKSSIAFNYYTRSLPMKWLFHNEQGLMRPEAAF